MRRLIIVKIIFLFNKNKSKVQENLHQINLERQDAFEIIEKNEKDNYFLLEEAKKLEKEREVLVINAVILIRYSL
jgi:hypothetical protein